MSAIGRMYCLSLAISYCALCHLLSFIRKIEKVKDFTYYDKWQKQPPEVLYKKGVLRNFTKFTGKHLCQSLFFNSVAGPPF